MPLAEAHPGGEGRGGEVAVEVLGDPPQQLVDVAPLGGRVAQRDGELALPALPLEVHHQLPGHRQSRPFALVLRHQGEGQVQAGADAGPGPQSAPVGADEDRVGVDRHLGMVGGELRGGRPVGGRRPPVQQAGGREDVGAHAHRGHPAGVRRGLAHPVDDGAVDLGHRSVLGQLDRARHQQGVHVRADLGEGEVGEQPHPRRGPDGAADRTGEPDVVTGTATGLPVGQREHLGRAGDVEEVDIGEDRDDDPVRSGHGSILGPAVGRRQ